MKGGEMNSNRLFVFMFGILCVSTLSLTGGQEDIKGNIEELFFVPSPTGYEHQLAEKVIQMLPDEQKVSQDLLGSVFVSKEGDLPLWSVMCGLDERGYIVGGVDPQGYITLDRVVPAPHAMFDSFFSGHPVKVWTEQGPVQGVLAIPSLHIFQWGEREHFHEYFSLEKMKLDIGASSRQEVLERGIQNCSPVTLGQKMSSLSKHRIAGYSMGAKACAALLLTTASHVLAEESQGKLTFGWLAQTLMVSRGSRPRACVGGVRAQKRLDSSQTIIVDTVPIQSENEEDISLGRGPVLLDAEKEKTKGFRMIQEKARQKGILVQTTEKADSLLWNAFSGKQDNLIGLFIPVRFAASPSETVDIKDLQALNQLLESVLTERRNP
ncbi:MAG: hypothetical protein GF421_13260 [Candidatus Aminicenantes bacterium]|nr:hypothetical protein [Candidatus Aminicenantes bacterium]